jgi:O-antigen/teichoic acid export membrane protein
MSELRRRTVTGLAWSGVARLVAQVSQFAITVVLARLLVPRDFGLVGLVAVFTGFATIFVDFGFVAGLIQRREIDERHRSTAFWLNVGAGVAVTAVMAALAPAMVWFYGEPRLLLVTLALSASFVVSSLGLVQGALMARELQLRRLALAEIGATVGAGAVAIAAAESGAGLWSLVIQSVLTAALQAGSMWLLSDWRPPFVFDRSAMRDLWGFSANFAAFNAVNYWARNGDNLLIGKILGPTALGLYSRAYSLMLLPISQIGGATARVMFPALSQIQSDRDRVRRAYLRANAMIALLTFPFVIGLLATADRFVKVLLGPRWIDMIPVLQILCIAALPQSIGTTVGWIYQSQGRTDWMFRWSLGAAVVVFASFGIGLLWGIKGVAVAYAAATILLAAPSFEIPGRLIGLRFVDVVRAVSGVFCAAAVMGAIVWSFGRAVAGVAPQGAVLGAQVALGAAAYTALVHVFSVKPYEDLRQLIRERLSSGRPTTAAPIA